MGSGGYEVARRMTTVVSDTSPINYLCIIGAIEVLPRLFERVFIPPTVFAELGHARAPREVSLWRSNLPAWVTIQKPENMPELGLDDGETEAISLALELHVPSILIDEKRGRLAAQKQGLVPVGTLSILAAASARDFLDFNATVAKLQQTSFHVDEALVEALILEARRRDGK